ncbi:type IX secretion system membrane protein PorP/SprF [Filimonas lacunae]|nr:type IX secretion system membrane protein PorP/SprF [Filimonas lacunae]
MLLGCILSLSSALMAQDPHFSQYFTSPMSVNPALTGKSVEDWRGSINMRSQWWGESVKPYYTVTAALEKRLGSRESKGNYWGIGGMVISDQSNGGILKNNYFSLTAAYHITLDKAGRHALAAGLTGTYANRILDPTRFKFQSQLGSMGFQRDIPANDPIAIAKNNYFDVSAGLSYQYATETYGLHAGAALFHVAKPKEGVYENTTYQVPRKTTLQAGGWFKAGVNNSIHISALGEMQGGNSIYTIGGVYKLSVGDELLRSVNLGAWERFGDAFYPYFGLEGQRWLGGFTYDFVQSGVKNYASVQSLELSFVWKMGKAGTGSNASSAGFLY